LALPNIVAVMVVVFMVAVFMVAFMRAAFLMGAVFTTARRQGFNREPACQPGEFGRTPVFLPHYS
jgi:hypothetical protein